MVGAVGIGLKATLKIRKLLIPLTAKTAKNGIFAQPRYTAGTRNSQPTLQTTAGISRPARFLVGIRTRRRCDLPTLSASLFTMCSGIGVRSAKCSLGSIQVPPKIDVVRVVSVPRLDQAISPFCCFGRSRNEGGIDGPLKGSSEERPRTDPIRARRTAARNEKRLALRRRN
jgi:hypothetical protein